MNAGFLQGGGTSGEAIWVNSLVNTFITHFNLEAIYLTAAGQIIDSGHTEYDFPLTYNANWPII